MTGFLRSLILVAALAACASGSADPESQAAASVSEPDEKTATSGFGESDMNAMRPETEQSRDVLWRLKGRTVEHQLRR